MTDISVPLDNDALDAAWEQSWLDCLPSARRLRQRFPQRQARFHALPNGQRYPSSPADRAEILRRHHLLLTALLAGTDGPDRSLVAITCSWSESPAPVPRDQRVGQIFPAAQLWRSDDLATDPGFQSWQHHWVARTTLDDPALDELLLCVADDWTDEVMLTDRTGWWALHPYDGGAEVFARSTPERNRLQAAFADRQAEEPARTPAPQSK